MQVIDEICSDLRQMCFHYKVILKIILWAQLIVAVFSVIFVVWFCYRFLRHIPSPGEGDTIKQVLLVFGTVGGTVTYGVLGFLQRNHKKNLKQAHDDLWQHCRENLLNFSKKGTVNA